MTAQIYNNVTDSLLDPVTTGLTEITVLDGTKFTDLAIGDYTPLYVIQYGGAHEIMHITGVMGDTLQVMRGQEGTDPLNFSAGSVVQVRPTRQALLEQDASSMSVTSTDGAQRTASQWADGSVYTFDSVTDMKAADWLVIGQNIRTLGYYDPGDGGGNEFVVREPGTGSDDSGRFITLSASGNQAEGMFISVISPLQFGANGDGETPDDAAFDALESVFSGIDIELSGREYAVSEFRTGNQYRSAVWVIEGDSYSVSEYGGLITGTPTTGSGETPYSGGVNDTPTVSGRTNRNTRANLASQNCRADFARSANIASIYSWAYGNVSGNFAGRQSVAGAPQSVNLGSEECQLYGFRAFSLGAAFSEATASGAGNIATRLASANVTYGANVASNTSRLGLGRGARLEAVVSDGVVTGVSIIDGGEGYDPETDTLSIVDRQAFGSGAAANFTVDANGAVSDVSITNGGSGYGNQVGMYIRCAGDQVANIATELSTVGGGECENSGNFATRDATTTGPTAGCITSNTGVEAHQSRATVLASTSSKSDGLGAVVISGNLCESVHDGSVVIGRRTSSDSARSLVFGDSAAGGVSRANRKFQVTSSGTVTAAGSITGSTNFTDYAEYFENLEPGTIPLGTIVALSGRKVRPAVEGDEILGVVSATAIIAAGDSPFQWSGRYMTGEFGEVIYQDVEMVRWENKESAYDGAASSAENIPDNAVFYTERHPVENPDYEPAAENIPRSQRPDEWTCVGLLGQVHVRVSGDVNPGDWVKPSSTGGVGERSDSGTRVQCMEIRRPFNPAKGYAVAFCLLR